MKTNDDHGNLIPVSSGNSLLARNDSSIGTLLIQAGRLTLEDAEKILTFQREQGLRFGDAAVALGLLNPSDIDFALARQFDSPYLTRGESKVSDSVVTAYTPFTDQGKIFSDLRGQLLLRWFDGTATRKAMAIISAERGDGRSFIAANLAVTFSQLGQKTLLLDADMRNPSQHALFGIENRTGLSALLASRTGAESAIQTVPGLPDLSILPTGVTPPNPLELLARPPFQQLLSDLSKWYDIIIVDTPSTSEAGDAQTVAVRAGAALIVARKNSTKMWRVRGISDTVTHASATVVGTILNDY